MDKLYSKTALIIKAAFCVFLAPLYMFLSKNLLVEDGFLYIILCIAPVGCLYTVPFWTSVFYMAKYRVKSVLRYVAFDAVVCLVPAFFGVLFCEIFLRIANGRTIADGLVTIIFAVLFLIISLIFWLIYFVLSKKK